MLNEVVALFPETIWSVVFTKSSSSFILHHTAVGLFVLDDDDDTDDADPPRILFPSQSASMV